MERVNIEVEIREKISKKWSKKLRKEGNIPAIVYGRDINIPLLISPSSFKILRLMHFSESTVIDMRIVNGKKKNEFPVLIKDIQYHPLTEKVIHIDFMKVSLQERIKVHVAIILKGEPQGVKKGGNLGQILRELELEGLPLDIPEHIDVDISHLDIGTSLHVADIGVLENLKVITDSTETVATVVAKKEEEVEEEAIPEEAVSEEPEVIKEKKEET